MAITEISRDWGRDPSIVRIVSTSTLAQVGTTGYILAQDANIRAINSGAFTWLATDMCLIVASDGWVFANISADFESLIPMVFSTTVIGAPVAVGNVAIFGSTGGNIEDLGISPSNAAYTKVASVNVPTIANIIPIFNDVNGSITDSAYSIVSSLLLQPAVSALTAHAGGTQAAALALTKAVNNVTTVATAGDSVRLPASAAGQEITITNSGVSSMQVYGAGTDTINGVATATGVAQLPGQTVVYTCAVAGNWLANVNGNPNQLQFASVPITAAAFNGMYATPVLLVAAPGANKLLLVDHIELLMTYVSANYAAGGVAAGQYDSTANGAGVIATTTLSAATFQAAASTGFVFNTGVVPQTFSTCVNKGLYLSNITGAFTTGDSTFIAKVYYRVVNTVGVL